MSTGRLTEQRYKKGKAILDSLMVFKLYMETGTFPRPPINSKIHYVFKQIAKNVGLDTVADKIIEKYQKER